MENREVRSKTLFCMGNKFSKEHGVKKSAEEVELINKNISQIHPSIIKFKKLQVLHLNENKLIDLPELPPINSLNASKNSMSSVPVLSLIHI